MPVLTYMLMNVHNAVSIGMKMAVDFQGSLPNGFHEPLRKQVTTMETLKKGCKVGNGFVYDMEKLYGRLLVVSQKRDINLKTLLSYELAPLPPALFDDYGGLWKGTKATLLHKLAVFVDRCNQPSIQIIDGNEMLC